MCPQSGTLPRNHVMTPQLAQAQRAQPRMEGNYPEPGRPTWIQQNSRGRWLEEERSARLLPAWPNSIVEFAHGYRRAELQAPLYRSRGLHGSILLFRQSL